MNTFKLLLVEDNSDAIDTFKSDLKRFKAEQNMKGDFVEYAESLNDAIELLDKSHKDFDGAIIDLKLGGDDSTYSGNDLIARIRKRYRIPIVIFTSTPQQQETYPQHIKVYTRGKDSYREVLEELYGWYQTGITNVAGGRGLIEEKLDEIFWNHLLPRIDTWKKQSQDDSAFEKKLLRFTVNHLMEYLDDDSDRFVPDEVYITPPVYSHLRTGCIVKHTTHSTLHVVLTPACDLALRNKKGAAKTDAAQVDEEPEKEPKTTDILLCEIEPLSIAETLCETKKPAKRREFFRNLANNNINRPYYHFLPQAQAHQFEGGLINFRKIHTISPQNFSDVYSDPSHQIASAFVKDIVGRFSSYYARQGQPEFDASEWIEVMASSD